MPREPHIQSHVLLEALKTCQIFDDCNVLKPRSDEVWRRAAELFLPQKISSDTLNSYVRNNRWNLLIDLKTHFNIPINEVSINVDDTAEDSTLEYLPYNYRENKDLKCHLLPFNLELTEIEWKCISPEPKLYKDRGRNGRVYKVLKGDWTNMIASKSFNKTKIPCAFMFQFGKVYESPDAAVYLHIYGVCKDCGASFDAHCLNEPAPGDGIILSVRTFDTRQIPHDAKRPITGELRIKTGKEILNKKPRSWRNGKVEEISFGDCEPPNLPREAAARKIKEQATNAELGIDSRLSVIDSLCEMKYNGKFSGYIKDVSKDRFYCFYWSPMQMSLYNNLIKEFRKVEVDATGSLVKSIPAKNGERRSIFLYQMIIRGENGIQPVFQMVSEKHDANFISYWMREILRDGASKPPEVNCDYSMALLNATSLAFNEMPLKKFILNCFKYVISKSIQEELESLIKVDIGQLLKQMCNEEIFTGTRPKVKDFFIRCIGVMFTSDNLKDLAEVLKSVLVLAGSKYSGKNFVCEKKLTFLMNRIKAFTFFNENIDDYEDNKRKYDFSNGDANDDKTEVILFLKKIREDSEKEINLGRKKGKFNEFYFPKITERIIKLVERLLIWTSKKYLFNFFNYVTSESVNVDLACFIRVDIAHLIKIMCKKEVFKGMHPKVKDFFVRCVGIMSTCDNIDDFSELLKSVLIVAGSEYSGKNSIGQDNVCEKKHTFLLNKIKTFTFSNENEDDDDENEREYDEYIDNEHDDNQDVILYFEKIRDDSEKTIKSVEVTDTVNAFYCPKITDHFMKLARHFPIWTNVMLSYFTSSSDVASSARCEAYFKNLKNNDLGPDYQPLRADKFIAKHIKSIESIAKLEKAKGIQNRIKVAVSNKKIKLETLRESKFAATKKGENNTRSKESNLETGFTESKSKTAKKSKYNSNHLNFQENWFGKNWEAEDIKENSGNLSDSQNDGIISPDNSFKDVLFASSPADVNNNSISKTNKTSSDKTKKTTNNESESQDNIKEELTSLLSEDKENFDKEQNFQKDIKNESPLKENKINRERGKYLKPCPNVELIYSKPLRRRHGEIVSNGSNCNPIFINNVKIYVANTCSFDATVEVLASCYANYANFKNEIDIKLDNILFLLIRKYAHEGVSTSFYRDRAEILCMHFVNKNNIIDCYGSASELLQKLITDTPSLVVHKNCPTCKIINKKILILSMAQSHGDSDADFTEHLKNFVSDMTEDQDQICRECKCTITTTTTVGPYLIIDPELFFQCNARRYPKGISLNNIPENLVVKNEKYTLGGIVRYTPGHFTALCRNPSNVWYEYNDMCKKSTILKKDILLACNMIFYLRI